MTWLYLVRDGGDAWVAALVAHQARGGEHRPTVVLLHEAVRAPLPVPPGVRVLAWRSDVEARGGPPAGETVDADGLVRLIEGHDRVAVW